MRALITGAAGFIGSALCRAALARGWRVIGLDKLTYAGRLSSIAEIAEAPGFRFARGDIGDHALVAALMAEGDVDLVLNLAAESHVDRSIDAAGDFIATNVAGTHTLLDAALGHWRGLREARAERFRFLQISTDEVFGELGPEGAFNEASGYAPRSPYAASKASADHFVRAWRATFGLPAVVTHCSNNFGPRQHPEKFIPRAILCALNGASVPLYGDGLHRRDWLHVEDHCAALIAIAERGAAGVDYAIGGCGDRANLEVARRICALLDERRPDGQGPRERLIRFVEDRPGHDRRYAVDSARLEAELGWRRAWSFEDGLAATIDWTLAHQDWWGPILAENDLSRRLGLGRG